VNQQIRDARNDFNHKISTAIDNHYGTVVVEDLNINGMQRNNNMAESRVDQGLYHFRNMFEKIWMEKCKPHRTWKV
jgi:putative transposase